MVKSIIKEIITLLLLFVAIILALGIFFYDYIPTNKIIPDVEEYKTSETIKQELNDKISEDEQVTLETYKITKEELDSYGKSGEYEKGKDNPFSTYVVETSDENIVTTPEGGSDSNSGTSSSNKNTNNTSKGNTVFTGNGTK